MGLGSADTEQPLSMVVRTVTTIFDALGMARRLRDVGVAQEDLPAIAESSMGDWFLRGNPRPVNDANELLEILRKAW
jgi:alcohol dehydrogenase